MPANVVVLVVPVGDRDLGVEHRVETVDVEEFVALAGVERFDVSVVPGVPGGMNASPIRFFAQSATASHTNSGPLSLRNTNGYPRTVAI